MNNKPEPSPLGYFADAVIAYIESIELATADVVTELEATETPEATVAIRDRFFDAIRLADIALSEALAAPKVS
jgi:hypothetical protein